MVLLAQPPSTHVSFTSTSSPTGKQLRSSSAEQHSTTISDGDMSVKCIIATPFATANATFHPTEGTLDITVHRTLAPIASDAFISMVKSKHFDGNYFFRVIPNFIVQWGIESSNGNAGQGETKFSKVDIDLPPLERDWRRSNVRGTLNFAGGNAGTGQVYINKGDNSRLDRDPGSLPFATLDERSMEIVDAIYNGYPAGLGQVPAVTSGDEEVKRRFPNMSRVERCWVVGQR
jgi:peptidyl-prolyl cis-trans isomerase A (cyclophilin A)